MSGITALQQWHRKARPIRAIMSGKQENTQEDLQEHRRAGGRKANSRDIHSTAENECQDIVEWSSHSKKKEETGHT
jgi:hypothetical protein